MSIPKIAVLVTGLTAAVLAATINPAPAQATPRASSCAGCHNPATAGTVTAAPSTTTPAPGAAYTVAISIVDAGNGGMTGYGIVPVAPATEKTFGGNTSAALSYTATMTAPAAAGTYSYTVWSNQGPTDGSARVGSVVYTITVAPVVTTPPPTTTTTTAPPPATAVIGALSPTHGKLGSTVTIRGHGFGALGTVQLGKVVMTSSSWTDTQIVFMVAPKSALEVSSKDAHAVPVWYRHNRMVMVTVTPAGAAASNAVRFRMDSSKGHGNDEHGLAPRHHSRLGGDLD